VAPGWLLYVSMVWLLPAVNPACYTLGANERSGNRQLSIKPAVKHVTLGIETIKQGSGRWEPCWEPSARTTSCARRTSTDRQIVIMPARGPIRTTLNA
jgi:hypothetical protein